MNYQQQQQLERSADYAEVKGLYAQAGLSLDADLATLWTAPRIAADPGVVDYLRQNIVFDGDLSGRRSRCILLATAGW